MSLEAQMARQLIHDSGEVNKTPADHDTTMAQLYSLQMSQQLLPGHVETLKPFNAPQLFKNKLKLRTHSNSIDPWISNYSVGNPVVVGCCEDLRMNPAGVVVIERI